MTAGNQAARVLVLGAVALWILVGACASIHDVRIVYRVPEPGRKLEGIKVFIGFQDERERKEILEPKAREAFRYYSGNVSLFLLKGQGAPTPAGLKDVPSLFRDVFEKRVERLGGEVTPRSAEADAVLSIALKNFSLGLDKRRWKAKMAYEARVIREDRLRARQEMAGEAERVRIVGLKQADQVMGELFTDVVNRLDLAGLFSKAGL